MKRLMKILKLTIILLLCIMILFNNFIDIGRTGYISYAAISRGLTLTLNKNGSITATWLPVSEAVRYEFMILDKASNDAYAYEWGLETTTYTSIDNLPANVTYIVFVKPYNSSGGKMTYYAGKILIRGNFYRNKKPGIPANITAVSKENSATVSWSKVNGANSYDVLFDGTTYKVTSTSKVFTGLSPNTNYTYSVRASNAMGSSAYSTSSTVTTLQDTPPAPNSLP